MTSTHITGLRISCGHQKQNLYLSLTDVQLDKLRGVPEVWCATTHGKKLESAVQIRAFCEARHIFCIREDFLCGASAVGVIPVVGTVYRFFGKNGLKNLTGFW